MVDDYQTFVPNSCYFAFQISNMKGMMKEDRGLKFSVAQLMEDFRVVGKNIVVSVKECKSSQ